MIVIVIMTVLVLWGTLFIWNPKVNPDGRFMKLCHWVNRRESKISWILILLMLQTVFFLAWQASKEIEKCGQQVTQLKKKCP